MKSVCKSRGLLIGCPRSNRSLQLITRNTSLQDAFQRLGRKHIGGAAVPTAFAGIVFHFRKTVPALRLRRSRTESASAKKVSVWDSPFRSQANVTWHRKATLNQQRG